MFLCDFYLFVFLTQIFYELVCISIDFLVLMVLEMLLGVLLSL